MPRGFSEREKERIRSELIEQGREFFTTYGIKKTNVEDLTGAVGISKGAFYLFYTSKEELFFEILGQWEDEYQADLLGAAVQPGMAPRQQVKDFLKMAFSVWRTHPLFTHFDPEQYEHLLRKLPEEKVEVALRKDEVFIGKLLGQWREHGVTIDCDPDTFLGLMRALFFISLHEQDLGRDTYPKVIDIFIGSIVQRIVQE